MDINTKPLKISQLLSGNEQFVIPPYQRRYSWQKKQIIQLFDDLKYLKAGETHFLGSIVCLTQPYTVGLNTLELVDGQQRMTTLILVLDALKDKFEIIGDSEGVFQLNSFLKISDFNQKKYNKILLGDLDSSDFETIIEFSGDNDDASSIKNKKLLEAYKVIKELIDGMTREDLYELKEKLVNGTSIVLLEVNKAKDAFKLFETINNRGLVLSPTDIIKNFLLGHASLLDDETLKKVKSEWTKIILNMDGQNLDEFFRQFLCGKLGRKITYTLLTDTFKKYYIKNVKNTNILSEYREFVEEDSGLIDESKMSSVQFLIELENASDVYSKILNKSTGIKKIDRALNNLQRIRSFPSYTFILNLIQRDIEENEKVEILRLIQVFMLRRNICESRTNELDDFFSKMTTFEDDFLVGKVRNFLEQHLPRDNEFEEMITKQDFYGRFQDRAKCMLEAIEYDLTGNTSEKFIGGGDEVHLEHIMPQTIVTKKSIEEEGGDWIEYLGKNAKEVHGNLVNKIGNMTLISSKKNIVASNNPFEAKKEIYKESEIKITKDLTKYSEFKADQINDRSKSLAKRSVKIWSF